MTVIQALEQHPRLVVVSGLGAGKSTLLRHLVQGLAEGTGDWYAHLPILISLRGLTEQDGGLTTSLRAQVQAELGTRLLASLPENFLIDWARQTEMPWLIALDGLDEIVDADRRRLLIRELKQAAWPTGSRVLITTRPDTRADLDGFTTFDLLQFEPEQVEKFAHNWFKPDEVKAHTFLNSLQAARLGELSSTPLLLTVAATVFENAPETGLQAGLRRSRLFAEFVRILLAEDAVPNRRMKEQFCQQFHTDLGERLFEYRREVLESIALALQEERDVRDTLVECLQQVVGWITQDAVRKADDVLKILVQQRVGLVVQRGDQFEFIHPSFREYLSAVAIVQVCGNDPENVWKYAISCWNEENWDEVALFALGVLSDKDNDVTPLLERIWKEGKTGLIFAANALVDRVCVTDDLTNRVNNALLTLARDKTVDTWERMGAVYSLMRLGRADDLLTLARDETVYSEVRMNATSELGRLGLADDVLTLARDETVDKEVRGWAARELGQLLGRADEAIPILRTLAHDETVDKGARLSAVAGLGQFGDAWLLPDLEHIAQQDADEDVRWVAEWAVEQIRQRLSGE